MSQHGSRGAVRDSNFDLDIGEGVPLDNDTPADRDASQAVSQLRLSALARHLQASIEGERAVIAREIHDDVGGTLTAVKLELAWISRHTDAPEILMRLASATEALDHAIDASKRIMLNLRPAILEQGAVAALQWLVQQFSRRHGLACEFRSSHDAIDLPVNLPLVAYRFVQESLTNVIKHSGATAVLVDLSMSRQVLSVEVIDNGRGFQVSDLDKSGSFGLRGLRERASTVGGWIEINSDAGGTVVMLSAPLDNAVPEDDSSSLSTTSSSSLDAMTWAT